MKNTLEYNEIARRLRTFFQEEKGFIEVPSQTRTSILAACEDPKTIALYHLNGSQWPLPQTGQMWLEYELLNNPSWPGVFCMSTSYRDEPNIIEGRHSRIFPLFEFESHGNFQALQKIEKELLLFLGFEAPYSINYETACARYHTDTLEAEHEARMCTELSNIVSLEKFPHRTHPFWNMKHDANGIYSKIDVILYGMETIGSAERSCNIEEMRNDFFTISEGGYSRILFEKFGKERVMKELDEYLTLDMFPRFGGGIGVTRLAHALREAGLLNASMPYIHKHKIIQSEV
jgi:aspartyl/asparaginyl-tRNA synthetase